MTKRWKGQPVDPKPGEPVSELLPDRPTLQRFVEDLRTIAREMSKS
jgi:hypothetical protein